jgi:hypothetical protein
MKNKLPADKTNSLMKVLKKRFEENMERHKDLKWMEVQKRLESKPDRLLSIYEMEKTGGEPDVIGFNKKDGTLIFCDCSPESPKDRRSLCYDRQALNKRKENKPKDTVIDFAEKMGVELLTEQQYRDFQELGEFDLKTSSWVATPPEIRKLGGAIFCDRRYNQVFTYHNGADSYYAARGFRAILKV